MKKHFLCLLLLASGGTAAIATGLTPPTMAEAPQQGVKVRGVVKDAKGEPIIGATVTEKNTKNAVVTDFDGNYTLTVANRNATLVVSYVGFNSQEVKDHSPYGVSKDCYNSVDFAPVKTTGLKILAKLRHGESGGVLEWKVNK